MKDICHHCEKKRELHRCVDLPVEQFEEDPHSGQMIDISQEFGAWHDALVCDECQEWVDQVNVDACVWAHQEIQAIKQQQREEF